MKYSIHKGLLSFDWNKFLSVRKRYSDENIFYAVRLSSNWITCACGQQCETILRDEKGMPNDPILQAKGRRFTFYIAAMYNSRKFISYERNRLRAKAALARIEKRSLELSN
jgi:hypothetical protein